MRRILEMEGLKRMVLTILYEEFVHDLSLEMSASSVSRYLPGYPGNAIKFALSSLEDDGFVSEGSSTSKRSTGFMGTNIEEIMRRSGEYRLTQRGISEVAGWKITDFETLLARITPAARLVRARAALPERAALTERAVDLVEMPEGHTLPEVERELVIDPKATDYAAAVKALDAALKAFAEEKKGDNRFGKERSELLSLLAEGRKLLDGTTVKIADVFAKLISPLRTLMTRHQGEMVNATTSALLSTALLAILKLFGLG